MTAFSARSEVHNLVTLLLPRPPYDPKNPATLCVLNMVFIWSVRGGIMFLGMRKVDMLNRSRKILYRSLKVDLK